MTTKGGVWVLFCVLVGGCGGGGGAGEVDASVEADAPVPPPDSTPLCPADVCQCLVDDDCGPHGVCSLIGDVGTCGCTVGYVAISGVCQWIGLRNPGFDEDPVVWDIDDGNGGAIVVDTQTILRWPGAALKAMESARQTIEMPTYERGEPLVAVMDWRRGDVAADVGKLFYALVAPMPAFAIDGVWQSFLSHETATGLLAFHELRECLGDSAYGRTIEVAVGTNESPQYDYLMDMDYVNIEPAAPGECAAPGEVLNGDFEGTSGWTTRECPNAGGCSVEASSGVVTDAAIDGRGGLLIGDCDDYLSLDGAASFPTPTGADGLAVEFDWVGSQNHFLRVGLGAGWRGWLTARLWTAEARPIGTVLGAGATDPTTSRVCVPPWAHGRAMPLKFQLQQSAGANCDGIRRFAIDNVSIVSDANCPVAGLADGDFENRANGLLPGWLLPSFKDLVADEEQPSANAHSGTGAARLFKDGLRTDCSPLAISSQFRVPELAADKRAKLSVWYKFMSGTDVDNSAVRLVSEALVGAPFVPHPGVPSEDTYFQTEWCFDPLYAGHAVSVDLQFRMGPTPAFLQPWVCAVDTDQVLYFDDVEVSVVDATACP